MLIPISLNKANSLLKDAGGKPFKSRVVGFPAIDLKCDGEEKYLKQGATAPYVQFLWAPIRKYAVKSVCWEIRLCTQDVQVQKPKEQIQ